MTWEDKVITSRTWNDEIAERDITRRNKEGKDCRGLPQQRRKGIGF